MTIFKLFQGMKKTRPVKVGVFLKENKAQSTKASIVNPVLTKKLVLPLSQYGKGIAIPIIKLNDRVLKGQVIAQATEEGGVPIYAPTSGVVISIEKMTIIHPSFMNDTCIVINSDGHDQWCECHPIPSYDTVPRSLLVKKIQSLGIVGLGGAGFPTVEKLQRGRKVKTLIINGAECESYITADDMLMRERADQIVKGIEILQYILDAKVCLIGIEESKKEAILAMETAVAKRGGIEVVTFPASFPSGDSKQLIHRLTGVEVPSSAISVDYGFLVQNIATAFAVFESVCLGHPMISRVITLTGDALRTPMNVFALLGTSVEELLKFAGICEEKLHTVIVGGGMMGFKLHTQKAPVTATTNCLIAASQKECVKEQGARACIRCGYCAQVCPVSLLPQQLYWHIQGDYYKQAVQHHLFDCIECGACSSVCPSRIPLVEFYRAAKGIVRVKQEQLIKSQQSEARYEKRKNRLEHDKLLKEKRRHIVLKKAEAIKVQDVSSDKSREMRLTIVKAQLQRINKELKQPTCSMEKKKTLQIMVTSLEKQIKQVEMHVT